MMRLYLWWPVLLGMAVGCGGGYERASDTADKGPSGGAQSAKAGTGEADTPVDGAAAEDAAEDAGKDPAEDAAEDAGDTEQPGEAIEIERDEAPDFEIEVFDGGGKKIKLSDLKGTVVLMNFWGID